MTRSFIIAVTLAATACGGSSHMGATSGQVAQFDQLGQQMTATVDAYRASATAASTPGTCSSTEAGYRAQMGPMLTHMGQMSGPMDDAMKQMGHAGTADMMCGAHSLEAEFTRHEAVACGSADMAANHAEANHHADVMKEMLDHQRARAAQLGSAMGMSGMMDAGSMMGPGDGGMMSACLTTGDAGL